MGTHYCNICRQTTFSGKKHIFGKQHQSRLRVVLTKFTEKVKEARRTIKNPQVEKFEGVRHRETFWCYCCEAEVEKHVTDDHMTVLLGGVLEHMATEEHKKNTHKFWWENKADMKLKEKVLITEEDMKTFKDEVANVLGSFVEEEDDFIRQEAAGIRAQEKHRRQLFEALIERDAQLDVSGGTAGVSTGAAASSQFPPGGSEDPLKTGLSDSRLEVPWSEPEPGLTFIGHQDSSDSGNVHTVPPAAAQGSRLLQAPSPPGSRTILRRERLDPGNRRRSGRRSRSSSDAKNKTSAGSFLLTGWGPTLTTARTRTPTGFLRLVAFGTAGGAGSPGTNSDKKKDRRGGRRGGGNEAESSSQTPTFKLKKSLTL